MQWNRREIIAGIGTTGLVALAGCSGGNQDNEEPANEGTETDEEATEDGAENVIEPSVLDSEPSSCPPQSRSEAETMPGRPDGFTVWDTGFNEDNADLRDEGTTYYADEIDIWYTEGEDATYRLLVHLWESADIAEEDWVLSPEAVYYKDDQEFEMNTALKARIEHITITIRTDNGGQSGIETVYDAMACVDQSHIISTEPE